MYVNSSIDIGWFVDDSCMNCDVVRQLVSDLIGEVGGRSVILCQPHTAVEEWILYVVAFACQSWSICYLVKFLNLVLDLYLLCLDEGVYLCGYNSVYMVGVNFYLLWRFGGNLLIDTPRWSEPLAVRYEVLGLVIDVFLIHCDHVVYGRCYVDRFGARLWIHEGDFDVVFDAD